MARETVIEYDTVERHEEVVWCDECHDDCTDDPRYGLIELCHSCALEHNEQGIVFGSLDYANRKLESLNETTGRKVDYALFMLGSAFTTFISFLFMLIMLDSGKTMTGDVFAGILACSFIVIIAIFGGSYLIQKAQ